MTQELEQYPGISGCARKSRENRTRGDVKGSTRRDERVPTFRETTWSDPRGRVTCTAHAHAPVATLHYAGRASEETNKVFLHLASTKRGRPLAPADPPLRRAPSPHCKKMALSVNLHAVASCSTSSIGGLVGASSTPASKRPWFQNFDAENDISAFNLKAVVLCILFTIKV